MPDPSTPLSGALVEEFSTQWSQVFASLAGERPPVETEAPPSRPSPGAAAQCWRQGFSSLNGAIWVVAEEPDWTAAGMHILAAAGMGPEDCDTDTVRSSYSEALTQALGGLAQHLSGRLGREVTPADGRQAQAEELSGDDNAIEWARLNFALGDKPAAFYVGVEGALADALRAAESAAPANTQLAAPADRASGAPAKPGTYDLLLDVELPISISFGMAEVPLKDVLKLTTGSIVELNRTIMEPVEVVVNNCVIARGEVVVVEGNFGVRIKQVISRQERLRTVR